MRVHANKMKGHRKDWRETLCIEDRRSAENGGVCGFDVDRALFDRAGRQIGGAAVYEDSGLVR